MRTGDRSKSAKPAKKTKNNFRVGRPQTVKLKNNTELVNSAQRPFTALPNVILPAKYIGLNPPKKNINKNSKVVTFTELKTKKYYWNDYYIIQHHNNTLIENNRVMMTKIQASKE